MRISVDEILCCAAGVCEAELPEVFEVQDGGPTKVLSDSVPTHKLAALTQVVRNCPTGAVIVTE
ncbi:ferredoxin [Rhodococcus sp. NPDC059968]|uniref:ferredoxin n=1 Tax=Rhodococcus sp. NPDC059968 TaxID=3347017 RepID=UPI003670A101